MGSIRNLSLAAVLVLGSTLAGAGALGAFANPSTPTATTTPGTDLDADIHAGETGEHATANDSDTAAEKDVNNGEVDNVDVQQNQTGDNQTGTANDKADASGDKADAAGDKNDSSGADGASGQTP